MKKISVLILIIIMAICILAVASCSNSATTPTNVATGAATKLVFATQPMGAPAGMPLTTQPVVIVEDATGNPVKDYKVPVSLALTAATGSADAVLFGGRTMTPIDGVVTFKNLSLERAGSGYTFTATSAGLIPAASRAFNVEPLTATVLKFAGPQYGATAGSVFMTVVWATDVYGNVVPSAASTVTLTVTPGTIGLHTGPNGTQMGSSDLAVSGTLTMNAVNGVATFSDLSLNLAGTGYTLTVTSNNLLSATSNAFDIKSGAGVKLAFGLQPTGGAAGAEFTIPPVVWVEDANGNISEPSTPPATVLISITPGTGTAGAVLSGTTTTDAFSAAYQTIPASSVAGFSDLSINLAGTGYELTASSKDLGSVTSNAFDVTASTPTPK